jgi:hypothetical protein
LREKKKDKEIKKKKGNLSNKYSMIMGRFKMDGGVRKDEISLKEVIFFHRVNPPRQSKKKKKKN